ncbi:signal peptidase II [Mycoplasmopsis felis]|uniref:signal peptidase II n=1 Tax=Mycoplasmopsis felis TaxID=33923 RepID=UPI0021E01C4D|nr:signal peptidase II [Mycoplasmopsis felis]MCU9938401.1 signal peptidase II [Mycoplasmopsis felis]
MNKKIIWVPLNILNLIKLKLFRYIYYIYNSSYFINDRPIDKKPIIFTYGDIKTLNDIQQVKLNNGHYIYVESIYPDSSDWKDFQILGVRSIWHGGVTFAKTRNTTLIQFFSIILFFVILFYGFFVNKRHLLQGLFIGFILSGDLGNMLDRFIFNGYVKDVFYIPFLEYLFKKTLVFLILLMSVFL